MRSGSISNDGTIFFFLLLHWDLFFSRLFFNSRGIATFAQFRHFCPPWSFFIVINIAACFLSSRQPFFLQYHKIVTLLLFFLVYLPFLFCTILQPYSWNIAILGGQHDYFYTILKQYSQGPFFQNCKFFPHQKWDLVSNMYTFIDWSNPGLSHCIHPSWHFNHFVARCWLPPRDFTSLLQWDCDFFFFFSCNLTRIAFWSFSRSIANGFLERKKKSTDVTNMTGLLKISAVDRISKTERAVLSPPPF